MMPKWHIFFGGVYSIIISLLANLSLFEFSIIFFSSWLFIDLDSVLLFIVSKKSINPLRFWREANSHNSKWISLSPKEKKKFKLDIRIFHSVELLLIIFLLAFLNKIFFLIFLGFFIHLFIDWADHLSRGEEIIHKFSPFWTLKRNINKKNFKH